MVIFVLKRLSSGESLAFWGVGGWVGRCQDAVKDIEYLISAQLANIASTGPESN